MLKMLLQCFDSPQGCDVMHRDRIIRQIAIAIALLGFNDLGFNDLLMDRFLYRFSTFSQNEENLSIQKFEYFCKMRHRIPFYLAFLLSLKRFQIPLEGLHFLKTLATFGLFTTNPYRPDVKLRAPIFSKPGQFSIRFLSETKTVTRLFCISDTSNSLSDCSKNIFNKIYGE